METPIVSVKASNNSDIFVRFNSSSIAINPNFSYHYNPIGSKPSGYIDFIHTFLHEIGHILCLDHRVSYQDNLKGLLYHAANTDSTSAANRSKLTQWASQDMKAVKHVIEQSKLLSPLNSFVYIKPLTSINATLSATPAISPANDTMLCANILPYTYVLSSSSAFGNLWSTGQTTQSIVPQAPNFYSPEIEKILYYYVRKFDESCTVVSLPSKPVKITWKKTCPIGGGGIDSLVTEIPEYGATMNGEFEYYPNPVNDVINIKIKSDVNQLIDVNIIDMLGNSKVSRKENLIKGENQFYIQLDRLSSGVYILQLNNGKEISNNTFIKSE